MSIPTGKAEVEEAAYNLLGVSADATFKDVRTAYLKLALIYHPDKSHDKSSENVFKDINNAYELLVNKLTSKEVISGEERCNDDEDPYKDFFRDTPMQQQCHRNEVHRKHPFHKSFRNVRVQKKPGYYRRQRHEDAEFMDYCRRMWDPHYTKFRSDGHVPRRKRHHENSEERDDASSCEETLPVRKSRRHNIHFDSSDEESCNESSGQVDAREDSNDQGDASSSNSNSNHGQGEANDQGGKGDSNHGQGEASDDGNEGDARSSNSNSNHGQGDANDQGCKGNSDDGNDKGDNSY